MRFLCVALLLQLVASLELYRVPPVTVVNLSLSALPPTFSVVVSVHNSGSWLERHLTALFARTTGNYELIVVFDGCIDNSLAAGLRALSSKLELLLKAQQARCATLTRVTFISIAASVWETSSDNLGMRAAQSSSQYFLLVQADMEVLEIRWNEWLTLPFRLYDDIIGVSARCAHEYVAGRYQNRSSVCDVTDTSMRRVRRYRQFFRIRDTANRGPLALHAQRVREMGFLDEKNFVCGHDEHDLFMRAYAAHRWKTGQFLVNYKHRSGLEKGTSQLFTDGALQQWAAANEDEANYFAWRKSIQNDTAQQARLVELGKLPNWNEDRRVGNVKLPAC